MEVRLDIWHFMRSLATGCTTDVHQLYAVFMSKLSVCIFEWDAGDIDRLQMAKRAQLKQQGLRTLTARDVSKNISKDELALLRSI